MAIDSECRRDLHSRVLSRNQAKSKIYDLQAFPPSFSAISLSRYPSRERDRD